MDDIFRFSEIFMLDYVVGAVNVREKVAARISFFKAARCWIQTFTRKRVLIEVWNSKTSSQMASLATKGRRAELAEMLARQEIKLRSYDAALAGPPPSPSRDLVPDWLSLAKAGRQVKACCVNSKLEPTPRRPAVLILLAGFKTTRHICFMLDGQIKSVRSF